MVKKSGEESQNKEKYTSFPKKKNEKKMKMKCTFEEIFTGVRKRRSYAIACIDKI